MQTTLSTIPQITTNRPAMMLPGHYAMQAISSRTSTPNVTRYSRQSATAIKWMKEMSKKKLFDGFAMGFAETPWEVFDHAGQFLETRTTIIPDSGVMTETLEPVIVDHQAYVQSVKDILGSSAHCLTTAEYHAHASSVGHSNLATMACAIVMNAPAEDLEHIYLVDSVASNCRVHGLFLGTSAVSMPLMDFYLDCYEWLSKGRPFDYLHHIGLLAYRMATLRPEQVLDILLAAGQHGNLGEDESLVAKRLQDTPTEKLIVFTTKMLEGLEPALIVSGAHDIERFHDDVLMLHAERISALYRETFLE